MDKVLFLDDYILSKLKENTDIPWAWSLGGPAFPKETTGYLCANEITFDYFSKDSPQGAVSYDLWIISPDMTGKEETEKQIETITLKVKDLLMDDYRLGGHALYTTVKSIQFAPPAGKTVAGASHISYSVNFEDYEEQE